MPKKAYRLLLMTCFVSQFVFAQGRMISLSDAINQLENEFPYTFSYDASLLDSIYVATPQFKASLSESLDELLLHQELTYQILSSSDVIILPYVPVPAQLCGYVIDSAYNFPLAYAHVWLDDGQQGTYTDENGYFSFWVRLSKTPKLTISYLGYQSIMTDANYFTSASCPKIYLKNTQSNLSEVLVKDFTTEMLEASNPNGIHFKPQNIPTLPGWGEPDLLRSLQLIPGISTTDESAANLNIRGGSSDQNLILWDDIPIYHTGHLFGFYSSLNPYIAKSIDIHRGGFGVEYGGRVSGVIDVKGKPSFTNKGTYGFGMNLINAHAFAELPIKRGHSALLIAARRSFTDIFQSTAYRNIFRRVFSEGRLYDNQGIALNQPGEVEAIPNFFYNDINLKWAAQPNDKLKMAISYYNGSDAFDYRFQLDDILRTQDNLDISNAGSSAKLAYKWSNKSQSEIKLISSRFENNYSFQLQFAEEEDQDFQSNVTNILEDGKFIFNHHWQLDPKNRIGLGLDINNLRVSYVFNEVRQGEDLNIQEDTYTGSVPSVFLNYKYQVPDKFTFELGLRSEGYASRADTNTLMETAILLPRYAIRYHPFDKDFYLQSSGGLYRQYVYQLPAFYNDLGTGENIWVLANDVFPVINAIQASLGVGYDEEHLLMEIEPYVKIVNNLPSWKVDLEEGVDNPFTQDGLLFAMGVDMLVKKRWKKYSIWAGYSLSFAGNQYTQLNNGAFFPADYDQPHRLNISQTLSLKRWDISTTFNLSSGRPYTFPEELGSTINQETGIRDFFPVYLNQNNGRLPVYHRMDIAVNYKFQKKKTKGKMGLSIFNLYNRTNLSDIDFFLLPDPDNNQIPQLARLERPMLRITPNLFVQFEFN
jgi:hypothetical protein